MNKNIATTPRRDRATGRTEGGLALKFGLPMLQWFKDKDILMSCKAATDVEAGAVTNPVSPRCMTTTRAAISRVRAQLRRVDEDAFTPHSVLIGLYNHRKGVSQWTEVKEKAVVHLFHGQVDEVMRELKSLEGEARRCYAHLPDPILCWEHFSFSHMLLHDGCYLLLLFLSYKTEGPQYPETAAGGVSDGAVVRDTVFLVENQIPLLVLDKIHQLVTGDTDSSVLQNISVAVQELLQAQLYISKKPRPAPQQSSHLLHLVHHYFQPTNPPPETAENMARRTGRWRRATEYRCHGNVRFKPNDLVEGKESTILDVSYQGGTLWIPRLQVNSNTWTILRNLMALEEQMTRRPVTAYCVFLSQVAGTVEDVKLLVRAGIVQQFLSSEKQAAQDLANLLTGVELEVDNLDQNYLKPIWRDLDMRCNKWVNRFMGTCREQHCRNGLYTVAFVITAILFACGLLQAVFAVLSYKYKK
ncbi:unnamed protein product [Triticum turgidum subsp. durum]|uniref:Uncharacterized protein n=1 Tax=Triticum turgidum subsp. durum TaxID=4567 RepID=A0A9R1PA27_TRITD|nr:unnamed protein product [Triticum turgidum subsp. durum]